MNQLCKVCSEPAAGYHFGAFTCEGCKSFFGRTYNNLSSLGECKNNGQCIITKKNRTSCKSCRLNKCFMVGMSKSGSRYGRRSNWFKIHCLIQEKSETNEQLRYENKDIKLEYRENTSLISYNGVTQSNYVTEAIKSYIPYDTQLSPSTFGNCESLKNSYKCKEDIGCQRLSFSAVSPMSSLKPNKVLFHRHNSSFITETRRLWNMSITYTHSPRFHAENDFRPVLKSPQEGEPVGKDYTIDTPEQETPIDLTVKKSLSSPITNHSFLLKDQQSLSDSTKSSPNVNSAESPLDLTRKIC
ncbi:uncharacterized protein LOC143246092 [Tachypleus tridentatus]|uniref:uncharacterized protein LOC143246092 n=1 Tax=Tachypleus tridentatus TaxID=6853 RepID=UPI003FCFFB71